MEYNIGYFISKCRFYFVDYKPGVCQVGKPCLTLEFKMVSKMAATPSCN